MADPLLASDAAELRLQRSVIRVHYRGAFGSLAIRTRPRLVEQLEDGARLLAERLHPPRD